MECHGPVDLLLTCSALAAFMLPFLIAVLRITVEPDNSKANTAIDGCAWLYFRN